MMQTLVENIESKIEGTWMLCFTKQSSPSQKKERIFQLPKGSAL